VNPYVIREDRHERRSMRPYAPLGPLYVAAALREAGHDVAFFDASFEPRVEAVERALDSARPAMVGVYTLFLTRGNSLKVARLAKARGAFVVAGGPDATVEPEAYLSGGFDCVVAGEGERTAVELASAVEEGRDWRQVPGVVSAGGGDGGAIARAPQRERIDDLDSLPMPARDLVDLRRYEREWRAAHGHFSMSIMASRGCPYRCRFCSRPIFGSTYRRRSVEGVVAELEAIRRDHRPEWARFNDDILALDRKWTMQLCDRIRSAELGMRFHCLCRAELMDAGLLGAMAAAGFAQVDYGVESGSQRVLDLMCKGQTIEVLRRVSRETKEAGISQHWFIMLGYPEERLEDVESTVALLLELGPESFSTTVAYPLKGTPLYDDVGRLMTGAGWRQSDDVRLVFEHTYPQAFYGWTAMRMRGSMLLRRATGDPGSPLLRGYDAVARAVSRLLARGSGGRIGR